MTVNDGARATLDGDLRALFIEVQVLCGGIDESLPTDLAEIQDSLSDAELRQLLTEILVCVRGGSTAPPETRVVTAAEVRTLVDDAITKRREAQSGSNRTEAAGEMGPAAPADTVEDGDQVHLQLFAYAGLPIRSVLPTPTYLGNIVPLTEGFANTLDIGLWKDNLRLKVDLATFRLREGREPDPNEVRQMLWPKGPSEKEDTYDIVELADDIAARGVQIPPIIDYWGTAWDGNRRLAACWYILTGDYTPEEKRRAEKIRVWQTDRHATTEQIKAIVTSLNFPDSFRMRWTDYVRAQQINDRYVERINIQATRHLLSDRDLIRIRQEIGKEFGIKTPDVTRYCKMMVWAIAFQDYHREQERDESEILIRTDAVFQYFFELDSGRGEDKLALKLEQDDGFRAIVFDLLFDGKFKNWSQIRELRRVYDNSEAFDQLRKAHKETNNAIARIHVNDAIDLARQRSAVLRRAGRADELARVTKWLKEDATIAVLSEIDSDVLRGFRDAARTVDGMITSLVDGATAPQVASEP